MGPRERALAKVCQECISSGHKRKLSPGLEWDRCNLCQTESRTKGALEYCERCKVKICLKGCRQPLSKFCKQQEHLRYRTTWAQMGFDGSFTCSSCRSVKKTLYVFHRCDMCRVNLCNHCAGEPPKITEHDSVLRKKKKAHPTYKFHYFISYKVAHNRLGNQPEGFLRAMDDELQNIGLRGFFNARSTKDVRMEKIQQSAVVVLYLNDETLHSASCEQELRYVTWEELPMVCVYDADNFVEAELYATYKHAGGLLTDCPWFGVSTKNMQSQMGILAQWIERSSENVSKHVGRAEAAIEQAAEEGLTLVSTRRNPTGFIGVTNHPLGGFEATGKEKGKDVSLGVFKVAEEAALAFARLLGPEGSAAAAEKEVSQLDRARLVQKEERANQLVALAMNVPGSHFKTDS